MYALIVSPFEPNCIPVEPNCDCSCNLASVLASHNQVKIIRSRIFLFSAMIKRNRCFCLPCYGTCACFSLPTEIKAHRTASQPFPTYLQAAFSSQPFPLNHIVPWSMRREALKRYAHLKSEEVRNQCLSSVCVVDVRVCHLQVAIVCRCLLLTDFLKLHTGDCKYHNFFGVISNEIKITYSES